MDIQWFGGKFHEKGQNIHASRMGTLEFDEKSFPNSKNYIAHLSRDLGVELMLIEESYISKYLPIHDQMGQNGFLAHKQDSDKKPVFLDANPWWGVGGMIDWTNPHAADFWHDEKRQKLIDLGIHFHWADLGEPEMYDPEAYYWGFLELGKNSHNDIHNIYAFKWLESIARGYERNKVDSRSYALSRAGVSGIQRFSGMWSGDLGENMDSLTAHLNAAVHMSLSGIDYYSSDIGGFHRTKSLNPEYTKELYTQWFADAALFDLPVRPHAWNLANNIETAPSLVGDIPSNLGNLRLRYALTPYYYSLMHMAHEQGEPIIPPLVYYFQDDPVVRTMAHERMIGRSLLAGAVAKHGERFRSVYLPKGRWYDYYSGHYYDSPGSWTEPLPLMHENLFRLPLFARAGAIIPLMKIDDQSMNVLGQRRDSTLSHDLILRIYADLAPSAFVLFEDDGVTNSEGQNQTKITHIPDAHKAFIILDPLKILLQVCPQSALLYLIIMRGQKKNNFRISQVLINNKILSLCTSENNKIPCWMHTTPGVLRLDLGLQKTNMRQEISINWH